MWWEVLERLKSMEKKQAYVKNHRNTNTKWRYTMNNESLKSDYNLLMCLNRFKAWLSLLSSLIEAWGKVFKVSFQRMGQSDSTKSEATSTLITDSEAISTHEIMWGSKYVMRWSRLTLNQRCCCSQTRSHISSYGQLGYIAWCDLICS